jgi:hypothetical protein
MQNLDQGSLFLGEPIPANQAIPKKIMDMAITILARYLDCSLVRKNPPLERDGSTTWLRGYGDSGREETGGSICRPAHETGRDDEQAGHNGCPDYGRVSPNQHGIEGDANQGNPGRAF